MFVQTNYQAEAHAIKTIFTSCNKNKTSQNATHVKSSHQGIKWYVLFIYKQMFFLFYSLTNASSMSFVYIKQKQLMSTIQSSCIACEWWMFE